ncbi:putative ribonuclease H-like domain-containing protein [Tanacetum coccineum]|uniref:Ribonuclease H-like domain-containing protein n=1 Tax=Tanacetum coccineum TaxID=301880 RepID=A0ABQ5G7Y9_9ASTR
MHKDDIFLDSKLIHLYPKDTRSDLPSSLMLFGVIVALIDVNAAQSKLVLLENFNENYSKCLRLLVEVTTASTKLLLLEEVTTSSGIPPPYTGNFMPPKPDLSFTGLDEFANKHVVENYKAISSKEEPREVRKNDDAPIIEEWVSDSEEENVSQTKLRRKHFDHLQVDCNYHQKQFQNQRKVKPVWNNAQRVNHKNFVKKTHPCAKKNMVPKAVLMKSSLVSINNARQNISKTAVLVNTARQVNTAHSKPTVNAARPMPYLSKIAHSTVKRPIHKNTSFKNCNINQMVKTVRGKEVNTSRSKAVVNAVKGYNVNAVKALACWVWKPNTKVLDHVSKHNSASITLKKFDYIDHKGRSKTVMASAPKETNFLSKLRRDKIEKCCFWRVPKVGKSQEKVPLKLNSVLFNDTGCIVLSPNFKLIDESQVLLRVPRKNNMYSTDLKNIVPKGGLTCLFAKATFDESKLWHRRLGHLNFKTMNKLVKENFVRGLPSKLFKNDKTCVACQKGKQHKASSTKDETSGILKSFITGIENLVDHKVKVIRCDNGTEFKNKEMNQFCEMKEAVNTACYVQNRVLVVKPYNKTPYELFHGRTPTLSFMRPFGYHVTILNTIDHLGKFDGKADEGFFVGYSLNSKAFRVFNSRTRTVEENLHIRFSENTTKCCTQSNGFACTKASDNAGQARKETKPVKNYILLPLWIADPPFSHDLKSSHDDGSKPSSDFNVIRKVDEDPRKIVNGMIKKGR